MLSFSSLFFVIVHNFCSRQICRFTDCSLIIETTICICCQYMVFAINSFTLNWHFPHITQHIRMLLFGSLSFVTVHNFFSRQICRITDFSLIIETAICTCCQSVVRAINSYTLTWQFPQLINCEEPPFSVNFS